MASKNKDDIFDAIIFDIAENGKSLREALKGKTTSPTFYEMIKDPERLARYARACEDRAEKIADEILKIADDGSNKDNTIVQRDRLRIDSRKWLLAKLHPKKYGDKLDVEHSGGITLHFDSDDKQA